MASIFTYDPDPPRVASPWIAPDDAPQRTPLGSLAPSFVSDYGVTKLQAEPQEGPTEYKLHLLLRPRRTYTFMSTAGSRDLSSPKSTPLLAASHQPRHERLKHLTTQLLWRLQQSSPFHASSSKELTTPRLIYESFDLNAPIRLEALVPGLEESRGALYEIGVSDDGTLVGLTKDEMSESIATLRVMAASLGCNVNVVRMVIVGECEWVESAEFVVSNQRPDTKKGRLWVAEALVTPNLGLQSDHRQCKQADSEHSADVLSANSLDLAGIPSRGSSPTPQLRVTLTGPTTSGKSTLLGTLSAGTLDNGRGKSRLSLLRHRHEMVSGVTSSIAQELIGYKHEQILNFAQGNIESWIDIHACAENGKLVFVSDSGGHPRYRRTVLRGLMSWAPHWSVLCVAADDVEGVSAGVGATSSAQDILGPAAAEIDLVKAHLTLSLKLNVPMAIVVTKLDLASKLSLQKTMVKVLTSIKEAGRTPKILQPDQRRHDELKQIPYDDQAKVQAFIDGLAESGSLTAQVPIVLTSAVKGTGVGLVHALLASLPLPPSPTSRGHGESPSSPERPKSLFHVDDTFSLSNSYDGIASGTMARDGRGVIVSGHVRFGSLSVGDRIVIGPFEPVDDEARGLELAAGDHPPLGSCGLSISHPSSAELAKVAAKNAISASVMAGEWHKAKIVSIRNLRLPVRCLEASQAGSVGLVFDPESTTAIDGTPRIRRGMVLALLSQHMVDTGLSLQAASGFTAAFGDPAIHLLTVGSFVNVYFASVRAAARVLHVSLHKPGQGSKMGAADDLDDIFELADEPNDDRLASEPRRHQDVGMVTLELLHNREWMELGSKILLLEGGSQDRSGLEGHVGRVVEIME